LAEIVGVLYQEDSLARRESVYMMLELGIYDDESVRAADGLPLEPAEDSYNRREIAKIKVRELLGQARMHVIEVTDPENARQERSETSRLLVRVDEIVTLLSEQGYDLDEYQEIEKQLRPRGADLDLLQAGQLSHAMDGQSRKIDILSERIGHKIDPMALQTQGAKPL
jgi:hypothetical protein